MNATFDGQCGLTLDEVLNRLKSAEQGPEMRVDDALRAFGARAFGPLLLIPSLVAVLPVIGALPGVSWSCSGLVVLVSLQFMASSRKLWLPRFLREAHMPDEKFDAGLERLRPWVRRLDKIFKPRLQLLMHPVIVWFVALLCFLLGLLMFVFSIVPGGIVIPAAAVLLIALALTAHDGLVLLIGLLVSAGAAALFFTGSIGNVVNAIF